MDISTGIYSPNHHILSNKLHILEDKINFNNIFSSAKMT